MQRLLRRYALALLLLNANAILFAQFPDTSLTPALSNAHIFVLHRFDDEKHASTSVTTENLEKHFEYLKKNHYHVASMKELIAKFDNNEPIPNNWVLFTIDDTYRSFYTNGLPLFKKYNYPFILYLYIEATQRHYGDFMRWEELKETLKYGEIGLHSFGHKHMTHLTQKEMIQDTQKALDLFKTHLGYTPETYVYPYGEFNLELKEVIKSFDFKLIFNQNSGAVSEKSDPFDLDRIALTGNANIKTLLNIKHLPAQWHEVKVDYKNRILHSISVEIDPKYKQVQCYVTGGEWHVLKLKEGKIAHTFNKNLQKGRTRVIIKTFDNHWTSKLITL